MFTMTLLGKCQLLIKTFPTTIVLKTFPQSHKVRHNQAKWITDELIQAIKRRDFLKRWLQSQA